MLSLKKCFGDLPSVATAGLVIVLAGCGGGGSSGGSTATSTPPPTVDPGNLLSVMPTAAYEVNSRSAQIFTDINTARGQEFGYVRQSLLLDKAANAHVAYLETNIKVPVIDPDGNQYTENGVKMFELGPKFASIDPVTGLLGGHSEEPGLPGFTGRTPNDRTNAAGYAGSSSEVVAMDLRVAQQNSMWCIENLLNTVFHRGALLNPMYSEVGVGRSQQHFMINPTCVISLGRPTANPTRAAADWSGVYPRPGAEGVPRAMWNREMPDPAPEIPVMGSPVSLFVDTSNLTVSKFTLSGPNGPVSSKLITSATNPTYVSSGQAYLVPIGALTRNTKYTAEFVGKSGTRDVSRTWSFTTVVTDARCDDGKTFGCS